MLLVADDDLGDGDLPRLLERPDEQPVRLLGALLRLEVVGLAEVDRVDLVQVDEVADVDRPRQLDVEPVEVLVLERDEAALIDLEAADDVVAVDVLAAVAAHLVVADRLQVALVQEVEPELLRLGRADHSHRHADEPKRDRAAPDRPWHGRFPTPHRAPPSGSGTTASTTPSSRQWPASGLNAAAAFLASPASRQRIAAQPSGEMTVYIAFSCISTRSASAVAIAPPEPPSPMMQATVGTRSRAISDCERAIAPPWPCCSAVTPG